MPVDPRHLPWQKLARRLVVPALLLAAVALVTVAAAWRASSVLKSNQTWVAEHGTRSNAIGAPDLFRDLFAANVARFDMRQFRIELPPPDCADRLRLSLADPRCSGARDDLLRLSQRLYNTAAGQAIRDEVARWNQAFDVIAVRDDRAFGQPCTGQLDDTATRLSTFILPKGCRPAQWTAYLGMTPLGGGDVGRIDISHRVAADPAPQVFGFLAADRISELGDWLAIDALRLAGGSVQLETQLSRAGPPTKGGPRVTAPRALHIDVVGDVTAVTIGTTRYEAASIPTDRQVRTGRVPRGVQPQPGSVPISREQLCLDAGKLRTPRCTPALLRNGSPYATRLVIPAATRNAATRIVIEAQPVRSISGRIRQALAGTFCGVAAPGADDGTSGIPSAPPQTVANPLAGCQTRDGQGIGLRQRITESLVFWCQGPAVGENVRLGADAQCFVQFDSVERTSQPSEPNVSIRAADGTRLAETVRDPADGRARVVVRQETIDLGLLPVVGIGDGDFLSLVGQLAAKSRRGTPLDVSLTIDPRLQRIVKEEVEQRLVRSAGQRNDVPASGLLDSRRRAAIILIDADQSPGDILAIATWPSLGAGERLGDWDLRALEAWNPPDSPLAALGWAQNNFLTVPGSSFKPVTALAALQKAIDGDAAVRQAIIGYTSEADLQRGMSLRFADVEYQPAPPHPLTIRNFQGNNRARGNVGQAFVSPARTGCPAIGGGPQIGLCEALLKSNNVWFARLADMTDIVALNQVPRGQRATEINMAQIVRRLYPPAPFPLADIPDARLSPGSRVHGTPIVLDSIVAPVRRLNPRITLAFNGIGQQVQTTPTAIASIYAGIGTGRIVRPRIVSGAPQPLGDLILRNVDERTQDQWLRYLRAGLKAVPGSPEGTASRAFRNAADLHPFLYAKTGTATVQDNDDRRAVSSTLGHTVWFAGYFDPRAPGLGPRGQAPINRRFAFVCMVTHARGGTGGQLCAPAIERVLRRMAGGTPAPARRTPLR